MSSAATLNTPAATALHQQMQQALPAGCRLETSGSSSPARLSATIHDAAGRAHDFRGTPDEVLADVLAFPATDAFAAVAPQQPLLLPATVRCLAAIKAAASPKPHAA